MALTNDNPREIITTVQLLGDVLTAVKALPNFEELATKAHALNEREQAKAEEARQNIATYQTAINEAKKQQSLLSQMRDELEGTKAEIASGLKALDDKSKAQNTREILLNKREGDLDQREKDLSKTKDDLLAGINKLDSDKAAFEQHKKAFADYEADLKETAAQMQSLTRKL